MTIENAKIEVLDLNRKLVDARHAYYVEANPVISDQVYDAMEQKLKDIVAEFPDLKRYATTLTTIGSDLRDSSNRVKHRAPMVSIENKYTIDDVVSWMKQFPTGTKAVIEPKVDGLSLCLRYISHKLVLATTRGDGEIGEDVTAQVFASPSIPKELHDGFPSTPIEIRGEAFISTKVFDKLNAEAEAVGDKKYANPRNLAAGTLKLKDLTEVKKRDIRFQPWEVHGLPEDPLGASRDLEYLYTHNKMGQPAWRQPQLRRVSCPEELPKAIEEVAKIRESVWHKGLAMQTDGLCIKLESKDMRRKLGTGTKFSHYAVAYKFQSQSGVTKLLAVEWQVGRSGILTPVGILEPVNLSGAITSRVNLNNLSFIRDKDLTLNCTVSILRSGDVIPVVSGLISPGDTDIEAPSQCPECGSNTTTETDQRSGVISVMCSDFDCPGKLKAHLIHIGQRTVLDIEGLGPQLITQIVDAGVIEDIGDLYLWSLNMRNLLESRGSEWLESRIKKEGYPVAQTLELLNGLESSLNMPWDKWLAALGIPGIGLVLAKSISMHLNLQTEDLLDLHKKLLAIGEENNELEGLGVKKFAEIQTWCNLNSTPEVLKKLWEAGIRPRALAQPKKLSGPQPLQGENVCVTGEFPHLGDREFLQECVRSLGGTIKGVSKKLTILVAGDGAGPAKLAKAKELGIRIEDSKWLTQLLKDYKIEPRPKFDVEDMDDL